MANFQYITFPPSHRESDPHIYTSDENTLYVIRGKTVNCRTSRLSNSLYFTRLRVAFKWRHALERGSKPKNNVRETSNSTASCLLFKLKRCRTRPVLDRFHDSSKPPIWVLGCSSWQTWERMRKHAKTWESVPKSDKVHMSNCAKSWESVPKLEKVWGSMRKCAQSWESVPNLEKVYQNLRKYDNVC